MPALVATEKGLTVVKAASCEENKPREDLGSVLGREHRRLRGQTAGTCMEHVWNTQEGMRKKAGASEAERAQGEGADDENESRGSHWPNSLFPKFSVLGRDTEGM